MKRLILLGLTAASLASADAISPISHQRKLPGSFPKQAKREVTKKNGYVLYENFSGWNGSSSSWIPTGWSVDHRGEGNKNGTWGPLEPTSYYPALADGKYCFCIGYDGKQQDEWLISPEFTPEKNMLLSYYMRLSPLWFYDSRNINFITKEFEGDKITVYTLQVLIKEGDGEWKLLRDYAEDYSEHTYRELVALSNGSSLEKQTVDISEYVGKNVQVAFRYLGCDGDFMMLDAIGVGYPTLDDVWYMPPANSLYWGLYNGNDVNSYFTQMPIDIALYPVNAPITWSNMSTEDAEYTWEYVNQVSSSLSMSDNQDELSVVYFPERPEPTPKLYDAPVLTAEAPERIDGVYNSPVQYFQTGGSASYKDPKGTMTFSLFQFPMIHQEISFKDVMYSPLGAYSIPVFGHNEFSDDYWLDYHLKGKEPMEGNFAHLIGIGNMFLPYEDAPLVVNALHVHGWGRIGDGAELTATIYALDSELHTDFDTYTVVAKATIKGDEVRSLDGWNAKDYIFLPFKFDQPAVVKASEEHPAFIFMLEGFDTDEVEYFAPLQSFYPNESGEAAGYLLSEINLQGHTDKGTCRTLNPMQYLEDGKYESMAGTFAIGLDAEYPWLTTETENIEFKEGENSVAIKLNSYYKASNLKVEAPKGLRASISGRYDECLLTVTKIDSEQPSDGYIDIKGPGVALSIPVGNPNPESVSAILTQQDIEVIYDMSGRKVSSTNAAGVYIVKYSDGKVRKMTIK